MEMVGGGKPVVIFTREAASIVHSFVHLGGLVPCESTKSHKKWREVKQQLIGWSDFAAAKFLSTSRAKLCIKPDAQKNPYLVEDTRLNVLDIEACRGQIRILAPSRVIAFVLKVGMKKKWEKISFPM